MTDATPHIFPTLSRDKHSHLVSYPIGAEALSRELAGVLQHPLLGVDFCAGYAHQHLDKPLQHVISVRYYKTDRSIFLGKDAVARGVFDPRWKIRVSAVGRNIRHAVKTRLIAEGLPEMVRPWLLEMDVTGKTGDSFLTLEYDLLENILVRTIGSSLLPERP